MVDYMAQVLLIGYSLILYRLCSAAEQSSTLCTRTVCDLGGHQQEGDTSLRFFLLGDWGGLPVWPYVTQAQQRVANSMGKLGDQKNTHFQLALGDNIYIVGVNSANDSRFLKSFESVYSNGEALYKPWYVIAGNHDHYGRVEAQIEYTQRSVRWAFPNYYYPIRYRLGDNTKIDIFMLDTVQLCGNTREGKYANFYEYMTAPASDRQTTGPQDPQAAEKQWRWLEQELANSQANYVFVAGHYPVYSVAEHGPTPCLLKRLQPMLIKYKVNGYFSGHDHSLQHLNLTDKVTGWPVHYLVSGCGAYEISSNKSQPLVPTDSLRFFYPTKRSWRDLAAEAGVGKGGFVYGRVDKAQAEFTYYNGEMNEMHSLKIAPRR